MQQRLCAGSVACRRTLKVKGPQGPMSYRPAPASPQCCRPARAGPSCQTGLRAETQGSESPCSFLLPLLNSKTENKEERQKSQMLSFPSWSTCRSRHKSSGMTEPRMVGFAIVGPERPLEQGSQRPNPLTSAWTLLGREGFWCPVSICEGYHAGDVLNTG